MWQFCMSLDFLFALYDPCYCQLVFTVTRHRCWFLLCRVRKEEIQALAGPNEYAEFRQRLTAIDKFYAKHPNEVGQESKRGVCYPND